MYDRRDYQSIWRHRMRKMLGKEKEFPLWSPKEQEKTPSKKGVRLTAFLLDHPAPVAILCPGGGYQMVSCINEGYPIAEQLNQRGYHALVLHYRVGGAARYPAPMEDLAQAVAWVRRYQKEYQLDADHLSLWGASAAGHLCSYFGAAYPQFESSGLSLRPQAIVLAYPVISLLKDTHPGTRDTLLGKNASAQQLASLSSEQLVTPDYPPTFLWHCEDDRCVPVSNSIRFAQALEAQGVPHEYCQYPAGGHGLGLAYRTSAFGWFEKAVAFLEKQG